MCARFKLTVILKLYYIVGLQTRTFAFLRQVIETRLTLQAVFPAVFLIESTTLLRNHEISYWQNKAMRVARGSCLLNCVVQHLAAKGVWFDFRTSLQFQFAINFYGIPYRRFILETIT